VGAVSLIRLVDGVIICGLLGVWALGLGGRRLRLSGLAAFGISAFLVSALNLGYNARLTGSPLSFPLEAYYEEYYGPKTNAMGFGPERGLGWPLDAFPGHSPLEAGLNAALNSFYLNIELFGWASGSIIFAVLALLGRRLKGSDALMAAAIGAVALMLSLYWFNGGPDFGARYWFLMIVPLAALTARGIYLLEEKIWAGAHRVRGEGLSLIILCLCVLTLVNFLPWRAIDKYYHYLGMRPDVRQLAEEYRLGESLVLVQGNLSPDYQSAWVYNPLDPQAAQPVYAWDASPQVRQQILSAYSHRQIWVLEGPAITGSGYRFTAGPLPASAFTERP
jgi:hypothetical protein